MPERGPSKDLLCSLYTTVDESKLLCSATSWWDSPSKNSRKVLAHFHAKAAAVIVARHHTQTTEAWSRRSISCPSTPQCCHAAPPAFFLKDARRPPCAWGAEAGATSTTTLLERIGSSYTDMQSPSPLKLYTHPLLSCATVACTSK